MGYLTAAVVLVGAVSLLNLVLTLGVIRRLREHSELIGQPSSNAPQPILSAGETIGGFEATTTEGDEVSPQGLAEGTLVAFFSPDCFACKEQLPHFVDYAGKQARGRQQVLAVVVGDDEGTADLVRQLTPVARVVEEDFGGSMVGAFGIKGFPAFCRLDGEGVVVTSGFDLRALRAAELA